MLPRLPGLTYETLIAWLMHSWNGSLLIIFIIVATHHSLLGLQAVMDDYLHAPSLKRLCVSSTRILLLLMGLAGAGAIIKIIMTQPS